MSDVELWSAVAGGAGLVLGYLVGWGLATVRGLGIARHAAREGARAGWLVAVKGKGWRR